MLLRRPSLLLASLLLTLFPAATNAAEKADNVEAAVLDQENWDEFAPRGKEVDAIYGDMVLRNDLVTAVIAQPLASRNANMTVRSVGGQLIDFTTRQEPNDQLSAFYVGRRKYPFRSWELRASRGDAVQPRESRIYTGKTLSVIVFAAGSENRPAVRTEYELAADSPYLEVVTSFANRTEDSIDVPLEDDLRLDSRNEDIRFAPNGRYADAPFWIHDRYWGQAYGFGSPQGALEATSGRGSVLRYVVGENNGSVTIAPGKSFELERRLYVGANTLDVRADWLETQSQELQQTTLVLKDARNRPLPQALVVLERDGERYGAGVTNGKGAIPTRLRPGKYAARIVWAGVPVSEQSIEVRPGTSTTKVELSEFAYGTVVAEISDDGGGPIPCKVAFAGKDGTRSPSFGPHTAAGGVGNLVYSEDGRFERLVPPGEYEVVVSRGPEYDAVFTELSVGPGSEASLTARLKRTVDTKGWVSADFHSHSSPSGDNTGSQFGRVLNLVCEHVEFAPCTEHNRVSTYVPHIERLGIENHVATVSGMELTGSPLPLNHQNAFPLVWKPHTQDGGAPLTDVDPERQVERLSLWDDRSEKLIQQNHPDIGWLFFDKDGDGQHDGGYARSFPHLDVMEIHPIYQALHLGPVEHRNGKPFGNNRVFNWLQLLNQGFRIYGVTNTDAHYNFHGSGGVRVWIKSSTDEPGKIDSDEMVRASERGAIVMSNGPFLETSLRAADAGPDGDAAGPGEDVRVPSGKARLHVRVQCPNWFDVNRVFVLVNGRVHEKHDYRRKTHPKLFADGVVKFDRHLDLKLDEDAHVVVVTGGEGRELGRVMGPFWGRHEPAAISNPIFVDVDGNGFQPNEDTLGHPLPVKYRR